MEDKDVINKIMKRNYERKIINKDREIQYLKNVIKSFNSKVNKLY